MLSCNSTLLYSWLPQTCFSEEQIMSDTDICQWVVGYQSSLITYNYCCSGSINQIKVSCFLLAIIVSISLFCSSLFLIKKCTPYFCTHSTSSFDFDFFLSWNWQRRTDKYKILIIENWKESHYYMAFVCLHRYSWALTDLQILYNHHISNRFLECLGLISLM